jgi:hypothetical protein
MKRRLLAGLLLLAALGCGGGEGYVMPQLHPAHGVVKYGGRPLPQAAVMFKPDKDDPNLTVRGDTDEQGRFELFTLVVHGNLKRSGAPAGIYTVSIIPRMDESQRGLPPTQLAKKYRVRAGDNDFEIDVEKDKAQ